MAMTQEQRRNAALKAAAARRRNIANGTTSTTSKAPTGSRATVNTYKAPAPTYRGAKLVALAAIEDVFVLRLRDNGITQEARDAYDKFKKLMVMALAPSVNSATANEADLALRMATIHLIKLAF